MKRRDDLDVLRFLAVTGVVLYHIGLPQAQNGFVGVDIFFVLSGFLIMKSIMMDKDRGSYSLSKFLERRARRIIPALLLVLAVNVPVILIVFSPEDIKQVLTTYLSILVALPNIYYWAQSGYFDTEAKLQVFLHTWSIGLEVQFYVLIGLTVAILFRYSRAKYLMVLLKALSIGSFALCTLLAFWKPGINFYLLPSRIWEFTIGSIIAIYLSKNEASRIGYMIQRRLKVAGFAIVALSLFFPIRFTPWPSVLTLIPIFGAALVLAFEEESRLIRPILHNRILINFGKCSYGWFLWHWPVIVYSNYLTDYRVSQRTLVLLSFTTLLVAILQWHYFEKKFLTIGRIARNKFWKSTLFSIVSLSIVATSAIAFDGYKQAWKKIRVTSIGKDTINIFLSRSVESNIVVPNSACKFNLVEVSDVEKDIFKKCAKQYGPAILVIGDSHGVVFYDVISKTKLPKFVINLSQAASRPSSGLDGQYTDALKLVSNYRDTVSGVLFLQSGSYLLKDRFGRVDTEELFRSDAKLNFSKENIEATIKYLNQLSKYVQVAWVGPYVQGRINPSNPNNWYRSKAISNHVITEFTRLDSKLEKTLRFSNVEYLSSVEDFRFKGDKILVNGCIVWRDEDHFSECGRGILASEKVQFVSSLLEFTLRDGTKNK